MPDTETTSSVLDCLPEQAEAHDLLSFDGVSLEEHTRTLPPLMGRVGQAIGSRRKDVAKLRQELKNGIAWYTLSIRRREAVIKGEVEEHNMRCEGNKGRITVAGIEAKMALDPLIQKLEDAQMALESGLSSQIASLEGQLDALSYELWQPLEAKKQMLMIYSGQARVEKEAYNQQRGR